MTIADRAAPELLRARLRARSLLRRSLAAPLTALGLLVAVLVLTVCVAFAPTLTLLVLGLAGIALLAVRAPSFAVVGVFFLYGIEGDIKVRLGVELPGLPVSANALGAALIDLAFVLALAGLVRSDRGQSVVIIWRNAGRATRIGLLLLVAWLALSVLQTPVSGNLRTGISGFRLTQAYVLALYVGATVFSRRRDAERLLVGFLGVFLVVSAYGAYRAIEGPSTSERIAAFSRQTTTLVPAGTDVLFRNVGSFSSATALVSFLVPVAVFGLAVGLLLRRRRLAGWMVTALAGVALVGAHIRTALVAVALCSLCAGALVVFTSGLDRRKKIVTAVALPLLVVVLFGSGSLASSLLAGRSHELHSRATGLLNPLADTSMKQRFAIWRQSITVVKSHPLGTGIGTVGRATVGSGGTATFTDNSYLKVLREQGPLGGLCLFLGVFMTLIATAITLVRVGVRRRPIGAAALVSSLSFFVLALDSEAVEQPGKVLAWAFLGIALRETFAAQEPAVTAREGEARAP